MCVIDSTGNTVSLTQTLGTFFGSGVTVAGVLLNNARSNFSSAASRNAIAPGKQPRSSISPTILLKEEKPYMAVGSPGATRIIATVVQCIVNVVDYSMSAIDANRAPRFLCQKLDDYLHLESRVAPDVQEDLKQRGHSLRVYGAFDLFFGGAQIILVDPVSRLYYGSADPRRGGVAIGY
jgi:gamma-glutamyltranspeptidase/glutathione hydrolase